MRQLLAEPPGLHRQCAVAIRKARHRTASLVMVAAVRLRACGRIPATVASRQRRSSRDVHQIRRGTYLGSRGRALLLPVRWLVSVTWHRGSVELEVPRSFGPSGPEAPKGLEGCRGTGGSLTLGHLRWPKGRVSTCESGPLYSFGVWCLELSSVCGDVWRASLVCWEPVPARTSCTTATRTL
jgi:hypothetical protein